MIKIIGDSIISKPPRFFFSRDPGRANPGDFAKKYNKKVHHIIWLQLVKTYAQF